MAISDGLSLSSSAALKKPFLEGFLERWRPGAADFFCKTLGTRRAFVVGKDKELYAVLLHDADPALHRFGKTWVLGACQGSVYIQKQGPLSPFF